MIAPGTGSRRRRPTGTLTFLLTDIEGSTRRGDKFRVAMPEAVRRHDEIMRSAIDDHFGTVFKTAGDAFYVIFGRAEDAVAAAMEAQLALAGEDFSAVDGLRVRMALHTGTADERDGDYYGHTVNSVARLLALAHGGQVVLSSVTADLVHGRLPANASLLDLGRYRLKDIETPERVFQLAGPGLDAAFPPLRSAAPLPNNLPFNLPHLVGRETDVERMGDLLTKHHLVTITGPGGVGKTRVALAVGWSLLNGDGDGVWLVDLLSRTEAETVPLAIADVLQIALTAGSEPVAEIAAALRARRLLLIIDNCEHLRSAVAAFAAAVLGQCDDVAIVATSREALRAPNEHVYPLEGLAVPPKHERLDAANAAGYAGVALFVDRAKLANNRFELDDENAPDVAAICRELDGTPLAIKLAAARIGPLGPAEMLALLSERFRILIGGSSEERRHATMLEVMDWS